MELLKIYYEFLKVFQQRELYVGLIICTLLYGLSFKNSSADTINLAVVNGVPYIGYWFIIIMTIIVATHSEVFEQEHAMNELLGTLKKGHVSLTRTKLLVQALMSLSIVSYFFILTLVISVVMWKDVPNFNVVDSPYVPFTMNSWLILGIEFTIALLGSVFLNFIMQFLAQFIKHSGWLMIIGGTIFIGIEVLTRYGIFSDIKIINWLTTYSFNNVLSMTIFTSFWNYTIQDVSTFLLLGSMVMFGMIIITRKIRSYV